MLLSDLERNRKNFSNGRHGDVDLNAVLVVSRLEVCWTERSHFKIPRHIFPHIPTFQPDETEQLKQGKCCARSALSGEDSDSMTCGHVITGNMSEIFL